MTTLETPLEIVNTHTVNKYSVEIRNFVLHKEVTLFIHLSNDSSFVHSIQYKIEGDEYTQWGDDDSYIETIVQRELQSSILHMNKQPQFIKNIFFMNNNQLNQLR